MDRHQTNHDGRVLGWRALGRGPALLLVNGYAATADDWDPAFLAARARSFEVVCPDNRGVGPVPLGDPAGLTVDAMAGDAEALLDALGLERAVVAGWSMGGFVAQRLALRAPRRVAGLALISTDPGGPEAVRADPAVWARLTDRSGTPREQASRLIALLFPPDVAPEVDRRFGDLLAAGCAALPPRTLAAQEAAMAAWHDQEQPPPPDGCPPALAVCGDEDVVIPAANAERLAARWPGCRVARVAGGGHAVMAQAPERVAGLVGSLLEG